MTYNVKNLDLQSGNIIKTKKFTLEYYDDNKKDFHMVLYPNNKNLRVVSEQGQGAKGIEVESVAHVTRVVGEREFHGGVTDGDDRDHRRKR